MGRLGSLVPQVLGPGAALVTVFKGTRVFRPWEVARHHHTCCLRPQTFLIHFFPCYFIKQGLYMRWIKCGRNGPDAKDTFVALCDFPIVSLLLPLPPQPAFHSCGTTPVMCRFCEQNLTGLCQRTKDPGVSFRRCPACHVARHLFSVCSCFPIKARLSPSPPLSLPLDPAKRFINTENNYRCSYLHFLWSFPSTTIWE